MMTNAEKFQEIFGYFATEMWAKPEKEFLKWINSEYIESRPKGKWVSVDWANEYFDCSVCGNRRRGTPRYCEDCGADMRGE